MNDPIAVRSSLGWMLIGSCNTEVQKQLKVSDAKNCNNFMLKLNSNEMLSQHIERFWEIDIYGTKNSAEQNLLSPSENKALQILEKEIFKEDHFEVAYCGKTKLQYYLMIVKWHYSAFINYRKNLPKRQTLKHFIKSK